MLELILNPVENLPYLFNIEVPNKLKGLYVSDKVKNEEIVRNSKIAFSGREDINSEVREIIKNGKNSLMQNIFL